MRYLTSAMTLSMLFATSGCSSPSRLTGKTYEIPNKPGTIVLDVTHRMQKLGGGYHFRVKLDGAELLSTKGYEYEDVGSGWGRVVLSLSTTNGMHVVEICPYATEFGVDMELGGFRLSELPVTDNGAMVVKMTVKIFEHGGTLSFDDVYTLNSTTGEKTSVSIRAKAVPLKMRLF